MEQTRLVAPEEQGRGLENVGREGGIQRTGRGKVEGEKEG